jgi:hypothetical protein
MEDERIRNLCAINEELDQFEVKKIRIIVAKKVELVSDPDLKT